MRVRVMDDWMTITCPRCAHEFSFEDEGQTNVNCPKCREYMIITRYNDPSFDNVNGRGG